MPATPAWPPQSTPRLFVESPLGLGPLRIDGPQAHYLVSVMRPRINHPIRIGTRVTDRIAADAIA